MSIPEAVIGNDEVLVLDFGAQYAQLIARRVRETRVYSEIVAHDISAAELAERAPAAIILSGGPKSVHVDGAPGVDPGIFDLGIPMLGICYGAQLMARDLGGEVNSSGRSEYGRTELTVHDPGDEGGAASELFADLPATQTVWMSHFDAIVSPPEGFVATASSPGAPVAAMGPACGRRSITRGGPHPARPRITNGSSFAPLRASLDDGQLHRRGRRCGHGPGGRRPCDLRSVRRRRLGGGRRAGSSRHRRSAHLRVRGQRADAGGRR
jgi:GMP synthase (glutamine-hydrolysing) A subunit